MRVPSGDQTGDSAMPLPNVKRVRAAAPRQVEQPQVGLRGVLRVGARRDRARAIRRKGGAAKSTRVRAAPARSALPIEPDDLGVGIGVR